MDYWPLCAIISTNDRKEKSLAGVTAPWMGGCRADCEKRHRSVVCPCCEEERKPTSRSSARCMCVLSRAFFNDGPVTEGGPRLALVWPRLRISHHKQKFSWFLKKKLENLFEAIQIQSCGLNALQRQLTKLMMLFTFSPLGRNSKLFLVLLPQSENELEI